jgi:hypothetical protein
MKALRFTLLVLVATLSLRAQDQPTAPGNGWEKSIVRVEISRVAYDYYQPWNRRNDRTTKVGLVLDDRRVLTTSQDMSDRTLVRLQKGGRGPWVKAVVEWVDYHANLALLTVEDAAFWSDLKPADLGGKPPAEREPLQIVRWREGKLENRQAEFTQFVVRQSQYSGLDHVQLEMDSEIRSAGLGEPVVAGAHVVGITSQQQGRTCHAIPASFIRAIRDARRAGAYRGLGYFHFYWQRAENTATLSHLRLSGEPRGALVLKVPERQDGVANVLQPRDIILQIDGFDVDMEGDYRDPEYGPLMLENLATRGKWAGDDLRMKIWRDGQPLDVLYRLPQYRFSRTVVPQGVYDQPPEYLIVGGLVFQPLTLPYLQRFGAEWRQRAPFRFRYYLPEDATKELPSVVILSQILPDAYNIGYQEQRYQVVRKVNGRRITNLTELREALQQPEGEFHIVEFLPNESVQRIVLGAGKAAEEATRRVLQRFGIAEEFLIAPKAAEQ